MPDQRAMRADERRSRVLSELLALEANGTFTLGEAAFTLMLYCDACQVDDALCEGARERYAKARAGFNTIWAENR